MDLQARMNLTYDQRKKVLFRDASGTVVGMLTMQEDIRGPDGSLDELQREIDRSSKRGLVATWGTAEEIRAFELLLRRVN